LHPYKIFIANNFALRSVFTRIQQWRCVIKTFLHTSVLIKKILLTEHLGILKILRREGFARKIYLKYQSCGK
jgi:hypothetical protein